MTNMFTAIYDKNESQTLTNSSQGFLNNNSGVDFCLDIYCDDVYKNVSVLTVELRLNNLKVVEIANKTKSQILANTSHELRTQLGVIVGILFSFENTTIATNQSDMLISASDIILLAVNNIHDAAKLKAQKITPINRTFNLLK
ncbi:hypothetical protein C2G38_2174071 [Gigaspora rosea]|uniref:Signal transduction histidine kinase dimerisation/phosphoacceptor domain-containing protein n=1 Tax=Gigaspora rosea TaxID=44941 RepID=A0A397VR29_9GLOM|nr:hypothetical protein C2G38_2174071 [Gigaspora rosea]